MANPNEYDVGDRAKIYTSTPFQNTAGTALDPTTVTVKIKDPSGNIAVYVYGVDDEVVRADTGDYYMYQNVDEAGWWWYGIYGLDADGDYMGASENRFKVKPRQL